MKNRGSFSKKISAYAVAALMSLMPLVSLMSLVSLASCSSGAESDGLPVVDLCEGLKNVVPVRLSEIADADKGIRYIPLETVEGAFVGGPQLEGSLSVRGGFSVGAGTGTGAGAGTGAGFFIRAWRSDFGVHYFGPDGKFIRSIGKQGRAKGEFVFNTNIVLADDRDEIAIGSPQKSVVYNSENEFLREIVYDTLASRVPFIADLGYVGDGRYTNMCAFPMEGPGNPNVYMAVFGNSGKLDKLCPIMEEEVGQMGIGTGDNMVKKSFVTLGLTFNLAGEKVYARVEEDTLFKFDENFKLVPFMALDYGMYKERDWEHQIRLKQGGGSIMKAGDKMLFIVRCPRNEFQGGLNSMNNDMFCSNLLVYDLKTGKTNGVVYNPEMGILGLENDLDGGAPFVPHVVNGDKMYQILDAMTFIDIAQKSSSAKMKQVAATLAEESNPVIIEVTLK